MNTSIDYSELFRICLPTEEVHGIEAVDDLLGFLEDTFGEPEKTALSAETTQLTYRKGDRGLNVIIEASTSKLLGATSLAFGIPNPLLKPCPQSRFSGAWVLATGRATFIPVLGSVVAATAAATALALLDYWQNVNKLKNGLCQTLCTQPCFCTIDAKPLAPAITVAPVQKIFGVPILVEVTVTFSGWLIASCLKWIF